MLPFNARSTITIRVQDGAPTTDPVDARNTTFSYGPVLLLAGCYYDTEAKLYPAGTCDTTNVTWSATVEPIVRGTAPFRAATWPGNWAPATSPRIRGEGEGGQRDLAPGGGGRWHHAPGLRPERLQNPAAGRVDPGRGSTELNTTMKRIIFILVLAGGLLGGWYAWSEYNRRPEVPGDAAVAHALSATERGLRGR